MKEKMYIGKSLEEIEELAVKELGVAKEDLYFDVISENAQTRDEVQVQVMVDANPVKKGKRRMPELPSTTPSRRSPLPVNPSATS